MQLAAEQNLAKLLVLAPAPRKRGRGTVTFVGTEAVCANPEAASVCHVPVDLAVLDVLGAFAIEIVPVYREDTVRHERHEEEEVYSVQLVSDAATHLIDTQHRERPHPSLKVLQAAPVEGLVAFQGGVKGRPRLSL